MRIGEFLKIEIGRIQGRKSMFFSYASFSLCVDGALLRMIKVKGLHLTKNYSTTSLLLPAWKTLNFKLHRLHLDYICEKKHLKIACHDPI